MDVITRFAPSPTGRLHIGHAFSALFAYKQAMDNGGKFILRIEDIDITRCTPEYEQGIYEDLKWLGLEWEESVRRQSEHFDDYKDALGQLQNKNLLYPCFCTRKEIKEEVERSGVAPHGPEGYLYPGICRELSEDQQLEKIAAGEAYAFRLDMKKALETIGSPLTWSDLGQGAQTATPEILGDVVLARKDVNTSYHLSVTLDDHLQGVTMVTRGQDLFYATHLHRLLQALLDLNVPEWHHHKLLLDDKGKRFAKRDNAITLQHLRENKGEKPRDIMEMVGIVIKIILCLSIISFCSTTNAYAETSANFAQEATEHVKKIKHKNFISLSIENDSLGRGTDQHYTSGIRATYFNVNAEVPVFIDNIARYIPTFDINPTTSLAYSIGQNIYTPDDITRRSLDRNDRPWAAWLYASAGLATLTGDHIDELELTLGMVGPVAAGEQSQSFIHDILDRPEPRGWDNQLENEPGVIVSWRRRWPRVVSFEAAGFGGSIEPNFNISLGNIYTYAGSGLSFRVGPAKDRWQDMPPRVRPAIPGTGYFQIPEDGWSWYLFAGIDGRLMARNIFLDGNTFENSHSVDKRPFVADYNAGIAFTYEQFRISYSLNYRTNEYYDQDDGDVFGSLSFTVNF